MEFRDSLKEPIDGERGPKEVRLRSDRDRKEAAGETNDTEDRDGRGETKGPGPSSGSSA